MRRYFISTTLCGFCVISLFGGCADSGGALEYSALVAEPPDFDPHANPAYHYAEDLIISESTDQDPVRPVVELPANPEDERQGQEDKPVASLPAGTEAVVDSLDSNVGPEPVEETSPTDGVPRVDGVAGTAGPDMEAPTEPREIELLIPKKRFRKEGDSAVRVSYDDIDLLKVLNMEPVPVDAVNYFPAWLKELDGQRIRIRGFMYPTFEATGLTSFALARDNGICCFVRQPLIYDLIGVDMADGHTTDYIDNKPFDVEGVFQIVPEADDTELYQLYRISDAKVLK